MNNKIEMDLKSYTKQTQEGPCFICEMLDGNPKFAHHIIYEDEKNIAFLNKYPPLLGYVLVCPKEHRVNVANDFSIGEYLELQQLIYSVAQAMSKAVPTERVYILSIGSNQGNSHVHWHVASLPPNTPYNQQQFHALMAENGILDISEYEMAMVAETIRGNLLDDLEET